MEILAKCTLSGLVPLYGSDFEEKKKLKLGETYKVKVTKPRNSKFHRKFFALLNMAFQNQDHYDNFEKFRFVMTMKAGLFEVIETDKGQVFMPKSISFASMDDVEFEKLYKSMVNEVINLLKIDEDTINNEIINFL